MPVIAPSDLFLSPTLSEAAARDYLATFGLDDPGAADQHLQSLADEPPAREVLGELAMTLLEAVSQSPDPDAAVVAFTRYAATRLPRAAFLRYLVDDPRALGVLIEVMGTSGFLSEILIRNPEYFHWLVPQVERAAPEIEDLEEEIDQLLLRVDREERLGDTLRRFKRREILRIAARDIVGHEPLDVVTAQLSDLADVVTQRALDIAARETLAAAGLERLPGGFVVMGMGKLGGRELNYSSDIDLIFVYEPLDEEDDANHRFFHKLGRALLKQLVDFTDEGNLYRVDMRLRPMGRSGNIAYSLQQHAQYYDTWGETFERFALLKARPIAGDRELGRRFLETVEPFVFRRYLDHAALEEIHRHKQRAEKQEPDAERDVKIGRGGIREIEVFVQVLQLTYGAANPGLRRPATLQALDALVAAGTVGESARERLAEAYVFLRTLEHRLQLVQEQQTHALSRGERELDICARRLGLTDGGVLEAELERHRSRVREVFDALFAHRPGAREFESRQWFRMLSDELGPEEERELVASHGIASPEQVLDVIRGLDHATTLAPSRSMAKNVLSNLLPPLLERVAACARPGQVLIRLEQLTESTGAAASFFRALLENRSLRELVIETLDLGELTATRLVRHPELLDSLAEPLPDDEALAGRYRELLTRAAPAERARELRRIKDVEELRILVNWVAASGSSEGGPPPPGTLAAVHRRLSLLAEVAVSVAAEWVWTDAVAAGRARRKPGWVILALGKLGSGELTVHSDLDLVVVYDGAPGDSKTFLARQEMASALERLLEEPTEDGIAWSVDTRLRPEGKRGALAMPIAGFERYLAERAETWERLAWTRYRAIAGSSVLAKRVATAVSAFVYGGWSTEVPATMAHIRSRMERELQAGGGPHLELKVGPGGLVDIDFALQLIQIREGCRDRALRVAGTRELLASIEPGELLTADELERFRRGHTFLRRLEVFVRMDADSDVSALQLDPERLGAIGRRMGFPAPQGENLEAEFARVTAQVRAVYDAVMARLCEGDRGSAPAAVTKRPRRPRAAPRKHK